MTSSIKYKAIMKIREKLFYLLEKAQEMVNKPLQPFLNCFTDYLTPDINLLQLQTII